MMPHNIEPLIIVFINHAILQNSEVMGNVKEYELHNTNPTASIPFKFLFVFNDLLSFNCIYPLVCNYIRSHKGFSES